MSSIAAPSSRRETAFKLLENWTRWVTRPVGFHVFVLGFLGIVFLERAFLFPGTGGDDAEQLLFSQAFAWGYDIRNPPLYTWLVMLSQTVWGISIASVEAVKFTLFGVTYVLMFWCARRVLGPGTLAGLAALSPLAIYYLTWDAVLGYSHSIMMMTLCVAAFAALIRLRENGTWTDYALIGVITGLGIMSKYGFGFFMLALLLAATADAELRKRVLSWRLLAGLVLAAVIVAPHAIWALSWIADNPEGLAQRVDEKFAVDAGRSFLMTAAKGLWGMISAAVGFLLPLGAMLALLFWPGLRRLNNPEAPSAAYRRVLGFYLLILLVLVAVAVVASGITRFRTHYMFVLIVLPIWYFARVQANWHWHRAPAVFCGTITFFAAAVVIALPVKNWVDPKVCEKCYFHLDYDDFTNQLKTAGFSGGTILGADFPYDLAGNLRVHFPDSRVVSAKHRAFIPPVSEGTAGDCIVIWRPGLRNDLLDYASSALGAPAHTDFQVGEFLVPIVRNPEHRERFQFMLFGKDRGGCSNAGANG